MRMVCGLVGLVVALLLVNPERADACMCCDAATVMKPLGWTAAGGAILLEQSSNVACERTHKLIVWHVGKAAPAGCYDLLGNPDTRVACSSAAMHGRHPAPKARRSQAEKAFPQAPSQLEASRVRVTSRPAPADKFRVAVEVEVDGAWHPVWRGTLEGVIAGSFGATVWPSPRGDRALMLLTYTIAGVVNRDVQAHWVQLPPS